MPAGGVSLPALPQPRSQCVGAIEAELKQLTACVKDKNVEGLRKHLKALQGKYEHVVAEIRHAGHWSLEEQLATRVCKARAAYSSWVKQYSASVAFLRKAVDSEDLFKLREVLKRWNFVETDPMVVEAREVSKRLEEKYKAVSKDLNDAVASKQVERVRGALRSWPFGPDPKLDPAKQLLHCFAARKRAAKLAVEDKDLDAVTAALEMPVTSTDAEVRNWAEQRDAWAQSLAAHLPVVEAAVIERNLASLRRELFADDLQFQASALTQPRELYKEWQATQAAESRELASALDAKHLERVKEGVANWQFPGEHPVLAAAQEALQKLVEQSAELEKALAEGDLLTVDRLAEVWVLGEPTGGVEGIVALRKELRELRAACDQVDVEAVRTLLAQFDQRVRKAGAVGSAGDRKSVV